MTKCGAIRHPDRAGTRVREAPSRRRGPGSLRRYSEDRDYPVSLPVSVESYPETFEQGRKPVPVGMKDVLHYPNHLGRIGARIELHWIPPYTNVIGNKRVDTLSRIAVYYDTSRVTAREAIFAMPLEGWDEDWDEELWGSDWDEDIMV